MKIIQKTFFIFALLIMSFKIFSQSDDKTIIDMKARCNKSSATVWSESLNRCVGKTEARNSRHEVQGCDQIADSNEKAECFKRLAEQKTGLNSNPDSLSDGNTGKSAIMNGAGTAYMLVGLINGLGKTESESNCTSKKIFGITALAGTISDIWLKIKARNQLDDLKGKYKISDKASGYNNQVKAFQYLKEEQESVKDIASREKKRNLLLMLGYGAASVTAIYEIVTPHPECYLEKPKKEEPKKDATTQAPEAEPEASDATTQAPEAEPQTDQIEDKKTVTAEADAVEKPKVNEATGRSFKAETKNGITKVYEVDANGNKTGSYVVGDQVWDKSGKKIGAVDLTNDKFSRINSDQPILQGDLKKIGVYPSDLTNQASSIKFNPTGGATRSQLNGSTLNINEKK